MSLGAIVEGMEMASDCATAYLDLEAGVAVLVMGDDLRAAEDGRAPDPDAPDWQKEAYETADAVLAHSDRYLRLPSQFDIH